MYIVYLVIIRIMEQSSSNSAIELRGIVRNATKIGVEDGQAEDLINLRFRDGSWRASGDGRCVFSMAETGFVYSQLYIHTNGYRHLLGVRDGKLWWFADIDDDGVTFTALEEPVEMTSVSGDVWITQTGHLLTVIDEADDFEHFVFKTGDKRYVVVNMDVNGKATDRSLYPFGQVHFNLYEPSDDEEYAHIKENSDAGWDNATLQMAHADMLEMFAEATKKNQFTKPFLAVIACRLYDGSHAFASQPVLMFPRDISAKSKAYNRVVGSIDGSGTYSISSSSVQTFTDEQAKEIGFIYRQNSGPCLTDRDSSGNGVGQKSNNPITFANHDAFLKGCAAKPALVRYYLTQQANTIDTDVVTPLLKDSLPVYSGGIVLSYGYTVVPYKLTTCVYGSDLVLSIENTGLIDGDVIVGIDVFITNPVDVIDLSAESYKESVHYDKTKTDEQNLLNLNNRSISTHYMLSGGSSSSDVESNIAAYIPQKNSDKKILYDLLHSPFYLLKSYTKLDFPELVSNPVINLSTPDCEGLLENIVQQKTLDTEAFSRTTYLPKVSYMYNGRLHIAKYKTHPFIGYPIDLFHLHNHSVKVQDGEWFKGALPNLADNNDAYLQYPKAQYPFIADAANKCFACIEVEIDTAQGLQKVVRYIEPYSLPSPAEQYIADFIEDLNPLLTYPDARAKKMTIYIIKGGVWDDIQDIYTAPIIGKGEFDLKPHPYLNIAYYIDPDLKPIKLSDFISIGNRMDVPEMQNAEEYFPNGLKVSKTDNPMFFPVENTYRIGSAEIVALCSNTIAVGTGQTGAAPLYVFCKDGVYALFVDSSGQMTYSNARAIARDVCNNARSVTPIDAGVVFTTDRGLMLIAGEQVEELGAPAEGDVLHYADSDSAEYIAVAQGALSRIASMPDSICDDTDFLTYLSGSIIGYNHNERELLVSNIGKGYSYVMDRRGNWSRRSNSADEYVTNYPTLYRLCERELYKVDEEGDGHTSLEKRKESDNSVFYLSRAIKLGSIGFKRGYRFVVRGYFETMSSGYMGCYVLGSYDSRRWALLGWQERSGSFTDIGCRVEHSEVRFFRVCLAGKLGGKSRIDYMEISSTPSILNTKIR